MSLNHNQLQELIINLKPNLSSLTAEGSLHSRSRSTTYIISRRTNRKHIRCPAMGICELYRKHLFCCQECVFIGPLPSNGSTFHNIILRAASSTCRDAIVIHCGYSFMRAHARVCVCRWMSECGYNVDELLFVNVRNTPTQEHTQHL
jgi:hypothetical protein